MFRVTPRPGRIAGGADGIAKAGVRECHEAGRDCPLNDGFPDLHEFICGQAELLARSQETLAPRNSLEELLRHILSALSRRLRAHSAWLWLARTKSDIPVLLSVRRNALSSRIEENGLAPEIPAFWHEDPLGREMLRTREIVICEDATQDPRLSIRRTCLAPRGTRAVLAMPLLVMGCVAGAIGVRHARKRRYRPPEVEMARELGRQAALAIEAMESAARDRQAAVLQERTRIASDIHDTLAQSYTGIILQLEAAETASLGGEAMRTRHHIGRAAKLAREGLTEARRSLHGLHPCALDNGDLVTAFEYLIKQMTPASGLEAELSFSGRPSQLSPEFAQNLLRIGQEALTNTLKHAGASRFFLRLIFGPNDVRLDIKDNGCGFDPCKTSGGFGLMGMHERVARMDGRLKIESAPGQGTAIVVALPHTPNSSPPSIT